MSETGGPEQTGPEAGFRSGFVSILGRPNAGKSTLLNALIGSKVAIVADKPQTTRTSIQGVVTSDRAQIIFVDTPGIHQADSAINKRMMDTVRSMLSDRDLILYVAVMLFPLVARAENFLHGRSDLDDTIRRLQAFEKAGADVLFAPGLPDLAAVRSVCQRYSSSASPLGSSLPGSFLTAAIVWCSCGSSS